MAPDPPNLETSDLVQRPPHPDGIIVHHGIDPVRILVPTKQEGSPLAHMEVADALRSFCDPDQTAHILQELGWSQADELLTYVEIASDKQIAPSIRMAACERIHRIAMKALVLRGDIETVRFTETRTESSPEGKTKLEAMSEVVRDTRSRISETENVPTSQLKLEDFNVITPDSPTESDSAADGTNDRRRSERGATDSGHRARASNTGGPGGASGPDGDPPSEDGSGPEGDPQEDGGRAGSGGESPEGVDAGHQRPGFIIPVQAVDDD